MVNVLDNYAGPIILTNNPTCLYYVSVYIYIVQMWLSWGLQIFANYRSAAIRNHTIYTPKNNHNFKNSLVIVDLALRIDYTINGLLSKDPPIPSQQLNLFTHTGSQYNYVSLLRR